jgi:hypothetical protein
MYILTFPYMYAIIYINLHTSIHKRTSMIGTYNFDFLFKKN